MDFNETDRKISLSIKALLMPERRNNENHSKQQDAEVVPVDIDAVIAQQEE